MSKRAHNFKDLTGQRFGRLVVNSFSHIDKQKSYWNCICDCGNEKTSTVSNLKNKTRSCGCLKSELQIKRNTTHGMSAQGSRSTFYKRWASMKQRCNNPNEKAYKNYGARGITVCPEWMDFKNFYNWVLQSDFQEGLELDRIDNNKGYSPENCRWVSVSENQLNKRNNNIIEIKGVKKNLSVWSRESGIKIHTIKSRMRYGWSNDELLEPVNSRKRSRTRTQKDNSSVN